MNDMHRFSPFSSIVRWRRLLTIFAALLLAGWHGIALGTEWPGMHWRRIEEPSAAGWSVEGLQRAREFSQTLDTAAVVIVHGGAVVDEWGATALPLMCHSVRKSLLSALYGKHVAAGTIDLEATLADLQIDDNEPALTETERQATVRHLLQARSGVYHPALYETAAMKARRPERGSHAPGTFWYYNNWDFNALGTIFERLTGTSLFEEFERELAGPLQLQDFVRQRHTNYFEGRDSIHPAYPFELSARDLARFGLLMCRGGQWRGEQLLPAEWVRESTQSYSDTGNSGGYGYMWWVAADGKHFAGAELPDGAFSARGYRGQYLVIVPEWDLVVSHRVNSFQRDTSVSSGDFGKLLSLILAAAPDNLAAPSDDAVIAAAVSERPIEFDVLLRGGEVIDGTGKAKYRADVALQDGQIAAVGELDGATADWVVNAEGLILAPGFIDLHSHADGGLTSSDPMRRAAPNLITQGITTVVINQDGGGPDSIAEQRDTMQRRGVGLNVAQMVGHGTIRRAVMRDDHRRPATAEEIDQMRKLLRSGLEEGAFGLSAGLEYVPGRWSTPAEMEALVRELVPLDGVYIVHERSSGSRPMWYLPSRDAPNQPSMIDNVRELIDIGAATGATIVATHIKARGVDFWGSSRPMIAMIEEARAKGIKLYADQYAYPTSGSDGQIVLTPDWLRSRVSASLSSDEAAPETPAEWLDRALADESIADDVRRDIEYEIVRRGGGQNILVVEHPRDDYVGKSLAQLAQAAGTSEVETVIRLQLDGDRSQPGGCRLRAFSMSEEDVRAFAAQGWVATSSDAGIALLDDKPVHPRYYGAFPRKIRRYALDDDALSLEEAVRVSTSLPASIMRLVDRGTLVEGAAADLVVFDVERIRDVADAFQPHRYAEGIEYVFVNGQLAVDRGRPLGRLAGELLRRGEAAAAE